MNKIKAILFDFDGVIADTEPIYDKYMNALGDKYNLGIINFAHHVKGTPTVDILEKYFARFGEDECKKIHSELLDFEVNEMEFNEILGAINFLQKVKNMRFKTALVTSSQQKKMDRALKEMGLSDYFDSIITAERITKGKPDPMCYLLAAKELNVTPEECLVLEDSLHGVNSGISAGMKVIGITSSFGKQEMNEAIIDAIPNFENYESIIERIKNISC